MSKAKYFAIQDYTDGIGSRTDLTEHDVQIMHEMGEPFPIGAGWYVLRGYWLTDEQWSELYPLLERKTPRQQVEITEAYLAGGAQSPAEKDSILAAYRHEPEYV